MPESVTVCGLFPAPSVMVSVPVLEPLAVGSKNTPIEQLAPTVKVVPQVFNWPKSAGLATMLAMLIATLPVLVSVTFCGSPLVPTNWLGNVRLDGATVAIGDG